MNGRTSSVAIRLLRWVAVPLLALVALTAWALSSPVGSSPDEDYHLASIWCGQGPSAGACDTASVHTQRQVPKALLYSAVCFAFQPERSASCQERWFLHEEAGLASTSRANFQGDYPPVFYFSMNFLVGHDISRSVVAMRLLNAALFVGLVTAAFWLLPRRRRTMLIFATAVSVVPLGVFLIPSVNPSSWGITSAALVLPAVVGFLETTGRRRALLAALAVLGTVMGAGARADSAVYAAFAAVLATFLAARWDRGERRWLVLPVALCALSAASYLSAGQSDFVSTGLAGVQDHQTIAYLLGYNLLNVPELWAGSLGSWGLGWLDTKMPAVVWVVGVGVFGAAVLAGMRGTTRRKAVALVAAVAALWIVPTLMLVQSSSVVGQQVQPRYVLPLVMLLAQVALFRVGHGGKAFSRGQLVGIAAALGVTNAIALHVDFRRYLTGLDVFSFDLDRGREWWWSVPVSPMTLWVLGSVAAIAALVLCARALARIEHPEAVGTDARGTALSRAPQALPELEAA